MIELFTGLFIGALFLILILGIVAGIIAHRDNKAYRKYHKFLRDNSPLTKLGKSRES